MNFDFTRLTAAGLDVHEIWPTLVREIDYQPPSAVLGLERSRDVYQAALPTRACGGGLHLDFSRPGVPGLDVAQIRKVSRARRRKAPCAIVFHVESSRNMLRESPVVGGLACDVVLNLARAAVASFDVDEVSFAGHVPDSVVLAREASADLSGESLIPGFGGGNVDLDRVRAGVACFDVYQVGFAIAGPILHHPCAVLVFDAEGRGNGRDLV